MKFVVNRDPFARALGRLQGVLNRKAPNETISRVLLEASARGLRVAGTDLDVTFDGVIESRVSEPGRVTVDGKRLFEVVRSLPGEEAEVVVTDTRIEIRSKSALFQLNAKAADDYPDLPPTTGVALTPIDGVVFRELIERTLFSVSTDDSRANLNGVFFRCLGQGRVRMVSTDGHRLSQGERDASRDTEIGEREGVIIPRKGVAEIKRLLDEVGREVSLGFLDNQIVIAAQDLHLLVRLIDANFPDYRQVIPKSSERRVVLERQPFLNALKRIGLLANERTQGVRIELSRGLMVLSSDNPETGKAREEMEVEYGGADLAIAFNAKYVRDVLSILTAEKVELALNESLSPGLIREHGNDDYLFVVMPMRV